jgi:transcriptional regulator GlxA family with amidase domain
VADHLGDSITLAGLADAAGCSARSLHRGFREALDMTPMRYVREMRLRKVRDALLDDARRAETITELALAHGFSHLGEFAAHYRLLFGERPQQTRRDA